MKELVFFRVIVVPILMFSVLLEAFTFTRFSSGNNPIKAAGMCFMRG
jgi:hypothetical protein